MKKSTAQKITQQGQRFALKAQYLDKFGTTKQRQDFEKKRDKKIKREIREEFRDKWKNT